MRLFISINLPPEAEKYLYDISRNFTAARITPAKSFHLTLKFLGEVPDEKIDEIKASLEYIKFQKFKMRLDKVGFFADRNGHIRVIWVGLFAPEILYHLQKDVEDAVKKYAEPDDKKFIPHITLARVKFANDKDLIAQIKSSKIEKTEIKVLHFSLMKSELSPIGPKYTELAQFPAIS